MAHHKIGKEVIVWWLNEHIYLMQTASKDWVEQFQIFCPIQSKQLNISTYSFTLSHTHKAYVNKVVGSVYYYYDVQQ